MPRSLKLYIAGVATASAVALTVATLAFPPRLAIGIAGTSSSSIALGVAFWTFVTILASALPVKMPSGTLVAVSIAPVVAAMSLGGPAVAGWVALVGTTELREVRREIPWYGTLANHSTSALPAVLGGLAAELVLSTGSGIGTDIAATMLGAVVLFILNTTLAAGVISLRTGQTWRGVLISDAGGFYTNLFALAPLAWLMAQVYGNAGWWATLLFALPLYTTRVAYHQFVEMREMFTQTVDALSGAVDQRDIHTANHSRNVQRISVDIGRVLKLPEADLQALEWGGLLHDIGKIGVPDSVLLKAGRLTKDERMVMNAHPVKGAEIIAPVTKLAPELPIIRHHHEWYNGSGYPDRLIGDEIPRLARVLHVADAFEAMTAARPYRMQPLTKEQALGELRTFAGIQFDPVVVDAFVKTSWVQDVSDDPGRTIEARPVPLLPQAAGRMAQMAIGSTPAASLTQSAGRMAQMAIGSSPAASTPHAETPATALASSFTTPAAAADAG